MKNLPIRLFRLFRRGPKSPGQSLVEFTIMLPVLLIMISGLIELGLMLNVYLDLIDAAREAARWAADADPIRDPITGEYTPLNNQFYMDAQTLTKEALRSSSDSRIDWLPPHDDCDLDMAGDNDIVISAFGAMDGAVTARFPAAWPNGMPLCGHRTSEWTTAEIQARLDPLAPTTGLVLVEIFYDYHMLLGLPWITAFVGDPVTLHAYSIMPNANVEPTPTP